MRAWVGQEFFPFSGVRMSVFGAGRLIDFDACCHALFVAGLVVSPVTLQGGLCGKLGGGQILSDEALFAFLSDLTEVPVSSLVAVQDMVHKLYLDTLAQVQEQQGLVALLLPDDDEPLSARIEALSDWCRSYLSGLGQSGLSGDTALAADVSEAMRDLAAIALADPESRIDEDGEANYAELVEFVRVAISLIYAELTHMQSAPGETRH